MIRKLQQGHSKGAKKEKECKKNKLQKNGQNLHKWVNKLNLLQNFLRILNSKFISIQKY
jgi:hypothetical protein